MVGCAFTSANVKSECPSTAVMRGLSRKWVWRCAADSTPRSEEHTSELQSLMRISYAVFCLKKKKNIQTSGKVTTRTALTSEHYLITHSQHTHRLNTNNTHH